MGLIMSSKIFTNIAVWKKKRSLFSDCSFIPVVYDRFTIHPQSKVWGNLHSVLTRQT